MKPSLIPVILAGGKGERFWPLSRRHRPKQFLCLDGGDRSLLQATADRLFPMAGGWEHLWVITAELVAAGVREQLPQLPESNLLIEPEGRDTAPAVAWATLKIAQRYGEEALVGFFPADHWIGDQACYEATLQAAADLARREAAIVTLGIRPNAPATGYGYIEQGEPTPTAGDLPVFKVSRFTEKPDATTAQGFIDTGRFSWNSGMFIFRAGVMLAELARYAPQVLEPLRAQGQGAYGQLEKKSIDYALMEKTQLAYVLPADFGWDDLGDWNALERLNPKQGENVVVGQHIGRDTTGAIVYASDPDEVVVTIGLEDVVIVRDRHITLIVPKHRTQEIKTLLKDIQDDNQYDHLL